MLSCLPRVAGEQGAVLGLLGGHGREEPHEEAVHAGRAPKVAPGRAVDELERFERGGAEAKRGEAEQVRREERRGFAPALAGRVPREEAPHAPCHFAGDRARARRHVRPEPERRQSRGHRGRVQEVVRVP